MSQKEHLKDQSIKYLLVNIGVGIPYRQNIVIHKNLEFPSCENTCKLSLYIKYTRSPYFEQ